VERWAERHSQKCLGFNMVNILPKVPGFGERIGGAIGGGFATGMSQAAEFAQKMAAEKSKMKQRMDAIREIENPSRQSTQLSEEDKRSKFLEMLPQFENAKGSELTSEDLDSVWQNFDKILMATRQGPTQRTSEDPFGKAKKYAAIGEHDLSRIATAEATQQSKQSFAREQAMEPKILEMQGELATSKDTGLRFDRLKELTSPQFENKFPPSAMTALFTKNGELNPIAQSQLSPEAQEFTKLVVDEIQGAQKTYGGKVSNFEAAQYLKKLPSLLNTADGRNRVLRDLRIMNKLTQMHDQGVLDIMDRYDNNISLSKANSLYAKEHAKDEANMRKAFIRPNEFPFTELDEFNASIYPGVTIEDPETGQTFKSDGRTWVQV